MNDTPGVSLFQGTNINIENALQNQEEAEDIEDQKRRQEEIQNLLLKEMDEFNYDESSINSSTNVSADETDQYGFIQKYKDTSMNNQLKVLYEVRVREIKTLSEQLENIQAEFNCYKNDTKRQILLLEAEKDKINISYKQSQEILVDKNEESRMLHNRIENLNVVIEKMQGEIKNLTDDNIAYNHANKELLQKITLNENGITSNAISDRHIQEQNHAELLKLNSSLNAALSKLDRREKECKEMELKLQNMSREKDDLIVEKSAVINKLTVHLESAQSQSQDLMEVIEKLSMENQNLKKSLANKSTDDSTRMLGLLEKSELLKGLQKELDKSQEAFKKQADEYNNLKSSHSELQQQFNIKQLDLEKCEEKLKLVSQSNDKMEEDLQSQVNEIKNLGQKLEDLRYLQIENNAYEKRVRELEKILMEVKDKSVHETGMQVSAFFENKDEIIRLENQIVVAQKEIVNLNTELSEAHKEIDSLATQITLSKEREQLLKTLQEKAAHFEKVILEKQKGPSTATISTNTDNTQDNAELLTAKYEAEMIQKEIDIRLSIKKEFDGKFEKMHKELRQQLQSNEKCDDCAMMQLQLKQYDVMLNKTKEELKKNKSQRQEDREMIAKLLDVWKEKFYSLENQNQELAVKYLKVKNHCEDLVAKLKTREDEDQKLFNMFKTEAEIAVKFWNEQALSHVITATTENKNRINEVQSKFELYSKKADQEIKSIELEYQKKRRLYENKIKAFS